MRNLLIKIIAFLKVMYKAFMEKLGRYEVKVRKSTDKFDKKEFDK